MKRRKMQLLSALGVTTLINFAWMPGAFSYSEIDSPVVNPAFADFYEHCAYWYILRAWKDKKDSLRNVSCIVTLDDSGNPSGVRIAESAGSSVIDKTALELVETAALERLSLAYKGRWHGQTEVIVQFFEYPDLRFRKGTGQHSLQMWPSGPNSKISLSTMSDELILNLLLDHRYYPLETTEPLTSPVSCTFNVDKDGSVKNVRIFKSSGSTTIDNSAIASLESALPPFETPLGPLHAPQELVIQFFPSQELRFKWKKDDKWIPIGRSGGCADPK